MKSAKRYLWCLIGLMLCLAVAEAAVDPMPRPLPDFSLTKLDGSTLSSKQLPSLHRWLLIFTQPNCPNCDAFLRTINKTDLPNVPPHVVVVVSGATVEKVKEMMANFPDLAASSWYGDPSRNAAKQLKLAGLPAVFGLYQNNLQWCILGLLSNDTAKMKSIFLSWTKN